MAEALPPRVSVWVYLWTRLSIPRTHSRRGFGTTVQSVLQEFCCALCILPYVCLESPIRLKISCHHIEKQPPLNDIDRSDDAMRDGMASGIVLACSHLGTLCSLAFQISRLTACRFSDDEEYKMYIFPG